MKPEHYAYLIGLGMVLLYLRWRKNADIGAFTQASNEYQETLISGPQATANYLDFIKLTRGTS